MKRHFIVSLCLSTGLHCSLLGFLFSPGCFKEVIKKCGINLEGGKSEHKNPKVGNEDGDALISPKEQKKNSEQEVEITLIDPLSFDKTRKSPHINDNCIEFYGGIGISTTIETGGVRVMHVYPSYPAALSGLPENVLIVSPQEIRGEIGTPVKIIFLDSNNTKHELDMIRDKICTEKVK